MLMDHLLPPNSFLKLYKAIYTVSRRNIKNGYLPYIPVQTKQGNLHFKTLTNKQKRNFTKK